MSPMAARITNTALRTPLRAPYSAFSTTARSRAGAGKSTNSGKPDDVEIPAFNLRHITSSPRARFWLISGFCVLASIEGYGWYNFGPRILGWERGEKEVQGK